MSWSRNWLSSVVRRNPEVNTALNDLSCLIREYGDAAKPSACRDTPSSFLSAELDLFRPGRKPFLVPTLLCALASTVHSMCTAEFTADVFADVALSATIPIFVLGVSVVTLARSMSESGRFAVDYLNESCRMAWFCCFTLFGVLLAVAGRVWAVAGFYPAAAAGLCGASLGAAIACLAMLAFVVRETIRCSLPRISVGVVSQYAARRLCHAYLKETYARLWMSQQKDQLERICTAKYKAIQAPSQYHTRSLWTYLHPDAGSADCEILLDTRAVGENAYKDYDFRRLAALDHYLIAQDLTLYLRPHEYGGERLVFGILSSKNGPPGGEVRAEVCRQGRHAVRMRKLQFEEENDAFWDSQESALNEAIERAVSKADPIQVRAYLDAVNRPLCVLRQTRKHKVIRDVYGQNIWRGCDFPMLYLGALDEILARLKKEPKHRTRAAYSLARALIKSVWEETRSIIDGLDYHTMERFTWLAQQMYGAIRDVQNGAGPLADMRGQFGGFYKFADGWLETRESVNVEDVDMMRVILYDGLTRWLLMAIERKDNELVEQLCDAGREIVFGHQRLTFDRAKLVARHLVLAGHLMYQAEARNVPIQAVARMFCDEYSHDPDVDFEALVAFYVRSPCPPQMLDSYLHLLQPPQEEHVDLLTGGYSSSGSCSTGTGEMALAFSYLAAFALRHATQLPSPIAKNLLHELRDDVIETAKALFNDLEYGLGLLRTWRDACAQLDAKAEAKDVADAQLDPEKVEKWRREFWEAYARSSPILTMCLKNGNYEVDASSVRRLRYRLPKTAVIDWRYPIIGADGDNYGRVLGRSTENRLLQQISKGLTARPKVYADLPNAVRSAVGWLKKRACDIGEALVIVESRGSTSGLYREPEFMPPWKEDVRSTGFHGFFDGFPLVWLRKQNGDDERETPPPSSGATRVIAVDLRGWKGIRVRECVIAGRKFGDVDVRTWTDEEIDLAVTSGKLPPEDVDKAKGNCPVDVLLYWQMSDAELPRTRQFEVCSTTTDKSGSGTPPTQTGDQKVKDA